MASLDCMTIRGIRSFSDESAQLISFAKPLTVIVGANGCGKTTIIECLKYATTGELPPGVSSGQSFVHDPKIAGKSEVKAQIKLKFKNRIPQTMVCVRDLQLTQAKSKMQFKALDAVIMTYKHAEDGTKEKVSITHKCTEMDRLMPELLGVPAAVLGHVVFCHQEESNWPLQEGASLKKRFDEIFESARYTKALVDIKSVKNERAAELKLLRAEEAAVNSDVARFCELTDTVANTRGVIETLEGGMAHKREEKEQLTALATDLGERIAAQRARREQLQRLAMQAATHGDTIKGLEGDLDRGAKTPAEREQLRAMRGWDRARLDEEAGRVESRVASLNDSIREDGAALADARRKLGPAAERVRSLQAEEAGRQAAMANLSAFCREYRTAFDRKQREPHQKGAFLGPGSELAVWSPPHHAALLRLIATAVGAAEKKMEAERKASDVARLERDLAEAQGRESSAQADKQARATLLQAKDGEVERLQREAAQAKQAVGPKGSEAGIALQRQSVAAAEAEVHRAEAEHRGAAEHHVEALERDIGHAMARQEATGAALRACRAAAEQTASRNADRKRAREREEEVGSLIASHHAALAAFLPGVRVADLTASPALLPERVAAETASCQRALDAAEASARACAAEYATAMRSLERERAGYEALLRRLDEARDRAWALEDGELKTAAGVPFARKHGRGALSLLTKGTLAELRRGRGRVPPLAGRGGAGGATGSSSYAASSGAGAGYGRAGGSATSLGAEFSEYAASTGLSGLSGSGGHDMGVYPAIALPAALPAELELVTAADLAPLMEEAADAVERTRKETEATLKAQKYAAALRLMGELVLEERDALDEKGEERGCPVCGTPFAAGHTREDCAAHAEASAARIAACDAKDASQLQQSEALNSLLALWKAHLPLLAAYGEDWKAAGAAYERLRAAEGERRRAWAGERDALAALQEAKARAAAGRELTGLAAQVKDRLEEVAALAKRIAASGSDIARAVRDGAGGDGAARAAALDKDLSQLQAEHDEAVNAASELQRQLNELRGRQNKAAAGLLQAREKLNREQAALERVEALSRTASTLAARLADARAENKRAAQELNAADDALKASAAAAAASRERLRQETDRLQALLGFSQAQAADMQAFAARMGDLDARIRSAAHAAGLGLEEAAAHSRQLADGAAEGAGGMSLGASSVASSAAGSALAAASGAAAAASDAYAVAQEAERRLREQVDTLTTAIDGKRVQLGAVQHSRGLFSALRRVHEMREQQAAANEARRALAEELRNENDASAALSGDASPEASLQAVQFELQGVLLAMKEAEGRLKELYASVDDAQRTLQRDSYKTAEKRAHALLIKTHTLELAIKDLDRYHSALDKALARYHQLKIAEINDTIRELWGNTYAGNDIDAIEIRSDLDDEAAAAAAGAGGAGAGGKTSRSYNYRVVMMKGDAELDMRGRCSAGQKVLASIVIRLALAESFCCSTGIMALDEPTTNLDAPNKKGLARALAKIIELRRASNTLQLLVITHDEEFVEELGRSLNDGGGSASRAQLGTYFRVWREEVRPGTFHSRIEKQNFSA